MLSTALCASVQSVARFEHDFWEGLGPVTVWTAMSAAGDLTNPPGGKAVTRDEHREKCIDEIYEVIRTAFIDAPPTYLLDTAAAAFDALHGIAIVTVPQNGIPDLRWADLTTTPEKKL